MKKEKSKKRRTALITVCVLMAALFLTGAVYVNDYYHADETAEAALSVGESVNVEQIADDITVFLPEDTTAGLIFYPGGKVEYTAYAPLLRKLAERGVLCVLLRMPCNLAVLNVNAAEGIPERYPEIEDWYIGGHSLGGSMAANYAAEHAEKYKGLLLLAAYTTKDISQTELKVLSVYGDADGVLNMEKYMDNRKNMPDDASEYVIEGGCHAQFGSYGEQKGDGKPKISSEEQQAIMVEYILEWMTQIVHRNSDRQDAAL